MASRTWKRISNLEYLSFFFSSAPRNISLNRVRFSACTTSFLPFSTCVKNKPRPGTASQYVSRAPAAAATPPLLPRHGTSAPMARSSSIQAVAVIVRSTLAALNLCAACSGLNTVVWSTLLALLCLSRNMISNRSRRRLRLSQHCRNRHCKRLIAAARAGVALAAHVCR